MFVKCKVKTYPDGTKKVYVYDESYIIGSDDNQQVPTFSDDSRTDEMIQADKEHSAFMNLMRTRNKIQDYCLSNDFDMFWTLTFRNERENDQKAFNRLSEWLKYMKKKYGKFDYIFIPERHKDGCIHFHGVTGGFNCDLVKAEKDGREIRHNGHMVYNCANWNYGYSTVTKIRDKRKTASYITKYVTKNLSQDIVGKGKKKYWSSRGLRLPVIETLEYTPDFLKSSVPDYQNERLSIYNMTEL